MNDRICAWKRHLSCISLSEVLLALLMSNVTQQVKTISDWWELRHAWRLHVGGVAATAIRGAAKGGRGDAALMFVVRDWK